MSKVVASFRCDHCGEPNTKTATAVRRSIRISAGLYCNLVCAGLARRDTRTEAEKKEALRLYGIEYRKKNRDRRNKQKAEYFQRTYDPEKARIERAKNMDRHVAYLREYYKDPEKKAAKVQYDRERRAKKSAGDFWESWIILVELEKEIRKHFPSSYERRKARGYYLHRTKGSNRCLTATT